MSITLVDPKRLTLAQRGVWTPVYEDNGLVEDIKANGIKRPLIVNDADEVVDGQRRLVAALELGLEKVPILESPTLEEVLETVRPVDDVEDFAIPVLRRWMSLLPLVDYMVKLGHRRLQQRRRDGLQDRTYADKIHAALSMTKQTTNTLKSLARVCNEHGDDLIVRRAMEEMNRGVLMPIGVYFRFKRFVRTKTVQTTEEQRLSMAGLRNSLEVAIRNGKDIGPWVVGEEERDGWLDEIHKLVTKLRQLEISFQPTIHIQKTIKNRSRLRYHENRKDTKNG
jgi:hypothetical protein